MYLLIIFFLFKQKNNDKIKIIIKPIIFIKKPAFIKLYLI